MTDIVERLRDIAGEWADAEIREEAADKIEQLRKIPRDIQVAADCMIRELRAEIKRLQAENVELRALLREGKE
jgi:hypothetical protein